jgi:hypothetical protein
MNMRRELTTIPVPVWAHIVAVMTDDELKSDDFACGGRH